MYLLMYLHFVELHKHFVPSPEEEQKSKCLARGESQMFDQTPAHPEAEVTVTVAVGPLWPRAL